MFHVSGCDKRMEPDCVPYKPLCFGVEWKLLSRFAVRFYGSVKKNHGNGAAKHTLSFPASAQLFRQLFGAT